jgi:Na+-transporting NADH:ubiquinone oxidoreductase subunit NqrC
MKNKKIAFIIFPVLAVTLLISGTTYATSFTGRGSLFNTIANAIANKFDLNVSDVQTVIDDTIAADDQEMEKNRPARVDPLVQAVKDGKLSQAQADLITAKREEMKTSMKNLKDMTREQMVATMKTRTDFLKQWATDNGIPEQYIMPFGGLGHGRGQGKGPGGPGFNGDNLPPPSDSQVPNN